MFSPSDDDHIYSDDNHGSIEVFSTLPLALNALRTKPEWRLFVFSDNATGTKKYVIAPLDVIESLVVSDGETSTDHGIKLLHCYEYLGDPEDESFNFPVMFWMKCECDQDDDVRDLLNQVKAFLMKILRELEFAPVINPNVDFLIESSHCDGKYYFHIKVPKIIFGDMRKAQTFWTHAFEILKHNEDWRAKLSIKNRRDEYACFISPIMIKPKQLLRCSFAAKYPAEGQSPVPLTSFQPRITETDPSLWRKSLIVQPKGTSPTIDVPDCWGSPFFFLVASAHRPGYNVDERWFLNHLKKNKGWFIKHKDRLHQKKWIRTPVVVPDYATVVDKKRLQRAYQAEKQTNDELNWYGRLDNLDLMTYFFQTYLSCDDLFEPEYRFGTCYRFGDLETIREHIETNILKKPGYFSNSPSSSSSAF